LNRAELEEELRGALEEEIAYLKKSAAERTVSAVGGVRKQTTPSWILYDFSLEREFLLPDDSWVTARVGDERLRAVVVAVRGMDLVLGLEHDLGPQIARVEISVDATAVLERILSRLEEPTLATLPDRLARMAFGLDHPCLSRGEAKSKLDLDADKWEGLERAVGSELLFIWGPPGTGKTQVLAALCEVFVERGESVLLTSHTNVAVDEAIWRAAGSDGLGPERAGPLYETPARIHGKLLRYGPTRHSHLAGLTDLQAEAVAERLGAELKDKLNEIAGKLARIAGDRQSLREVLQAWSNAERATVKADETTRELDEAMQALVARKAEYCHVATAVLGTQAEPDRVKTELKARLDDTLGKLSQIAGDRQRLAEVLECWASANRAVAGAEAKERALEGSSTALAKRQGEHREAAKQVASARQELDSVLNPRGLRRLFRKDPAPFEQAVRRAAAQEGQARQALDSAMRWEARARREAERARAEAERLCAMPSMPEQEALAEDQDLRAREGQFERLANEIHQAAIDENRAWQALDSAVRWEARARREAESASQEAEHLAAIPSIPKQEALEQDGELVKEEKLLNGERTRLEQELAERLRHVIDEAILIASTLTRAAVDDNVCRRSFDNLIIDEASMAPMPLVYLASLAARKRVILVGDFRQLPPIVQARKEDALLAHKWLGRDIFEQVGIAELDLPKSRADLRVDLWEQHRMAPEIRKFASDKFYASRLRDAWTGSRDGDCTWAGRTPAGKAVSMVDTTGLGAWSQRSPGARPSKFNVYSALVAVELAGTLVDGLDEPKGDRKPVGIITPYRAQANLLGVLVRNKKGLEQSVSWGTVHTFQGAENDVIIFDYVDETPNWKAGPLLLDQGPRLMNVAVTRARHRLFVLGSYAHVQRNLKKSPLWDLVQYAALMNRIPAEEFLREDFHRAVADATRSIAHGEVRELDQIQLRVCNERDFFAALDYDLASARSRVVLFAPFLGHRAEEVIPRLRDCIHRGVDVYVVTRPLADQKRAALRSWYASVHQRLEELGVRLVFFRLMHQKLIFVDDHILYVGGLNPLSHVDTAEIMDRWDSKPVFNAHAEGVRLKELLSIWDDPNDVAMRVCPRDGSPLLVVAPVTWQEFDPMYWGCSSYPEDNYKRRFSHGPRRSGPRLCDKCASPMHVERKPSGDWWICSPCKRRRRVQEGEGIEPATAPWRATARTGEPEMPPSETQPPRTVASIRARTNRQSPFAHGNEHEDNLLTQLRSRGLDVIDRRSEGGALWVVGGQHLNDLLAAHGFTFAPKGSKTTRRRPAWYL
jgi:hypothetical protein